MKDNKEFVKEITPQAEDFSQWYIDVIKKADLADYAPVRGCMVLKPDGYEIWEKVQEGLDRRFKATGHRNAYFPLFIPESLLMKEAEHVEGFNPELPWVTEAGGEKLAERLAVRPTSETIIGEMYRQWIQTYRDLPVLLNQWCNVVRWEKKTRPFLRTTEFLWQEGHTAHRTEEEAREEVLRMLGVYEEFVNQDLAIPVIPGRKSEREKFAGAVETYSIEGLMKDGLALQAGTSHFLGQNFARVFNIEFLDSDNTLKHVWTTSWGMSTRIVGATIMVHGDDRGLKLPPKVAPVQVVIVPIAPAKEREEVLSRAREIAGGLRERFRLRLDDRPEYTPGWKFNDWEMRGVPVRVEIGPRDLREGKVVLVRRDTGEKTGVPIEGLELAIVDLLREIQIKMFAMAKQFMADNTHEAGNVEQLEGIIAAKRGFVRAPWCGDEACEIIVKERCGATIRNIPFDQPGAAGRCVSCALPGRQQVYFARAY